MISMMAFSMHCCTSKRSWRWLLLAFLAWAGIAHAGGIVVSKAELRLEDNLYRPAAHFSVSPNYVVEQALTHGVPLYFVGEFLLTRSRWYWISEVVARGELTAKLSYNILTRQYRITRGALFQNFDNLDDALQVLNHQSFAPFPAALLSRGGGYVAAVRLHLDVTQLPKPLQINALANTDWDLDSGWYRWALAADVPKGEGARQLFDFSWGRP